MEENIMTKTGILTKKMRHQDIGILVTSDDTEESAKKVASMTPAAIGIIKFSDDDNEMIEKWGVLIDKGLIV